MSKFVVYAQNSKGRACNHEFERKNTALEYAKMLMSKHPDYGCVVYEYFDEGSDHVMKLIAVLSGSNKQ